MSGPSAKQPKATAMESAGVRAVDSLPPELMETIFGLLDVRTLCTARLVCAQFRNAASSCICSLELAPKDLRSRSGTTFSHFPNLARVTVVDVKKDDLLMLAQSPVADAITHVWADGHLRPVAECAQAAGDPLPLPLLPLPNLTYLNVADSFKHAFPFPQTLRELVLEAPISLRTANFVTALTNLTSLQIDISEVRKPFEAVTALTALQRLDIVCRLSVVPFAAELTLLTHLQLQVDWTSAAFPFLPKLASITRLHRLEHLGVAHPGMQINGEFEYEILESVATFTGLRSLDLQLCGRPEWSELETASMAPFSELTALRLNCSSSGLDASFLPRFSLERLQDLSLSERVELDGYGVAALGRATGLTHLELWSASLGGGTGLAELGAALPRMSRLRALQFGTWNLHAFQLGTRDAVHAAFPLRALAGLTELTRLELRGCAVTTDADVEVCLGLKKLRVLRMEVPYCALAPSDRITFEAVCAIAKLQELRKFVISGNSAYLRRALTDTVWAGVNADRRVRGWPNLVMSL